MPDEVQEKPLEKEAAPRKETKEEADRLQQNAAAKANNPEKLPKEDFKINPRLAGQVSFEDIEDGYKKFNEENYNESCNVRDAYRDNQEKLASFPDTDQGNKQRADYFHHWAYTILAASKLEIAGKALEYKPFDKLHDVRTRSEELLYAMDIANKSLICRQRLKEPDLKEIQKTKKLIEQIKDILNEQNRERMEGDRKASMNELISILGKKFDGSKVTSENDLIRIEKNGQVYTITVNMVYDVDTNKWKVGENSFLKGFGTPEEKDLNEFIKNVVGNFPGYPRMLYDQQVFRGRYGENLESETTGENLEVNFEAFRENKVLESKNGLLEMKSGDQIAFSLSVKPGSYVYCLWFDSKSATLAYPGFGRSDSANPSLTSQVEIPAKGLTFTLDDTVGKENIFIITADHQLSIPPFSNYEQQSTSVKEYLQEQNTRWKKITIDHR